MNYEKIAKLSSRITETQALMNFIEKRLNDEKLILPMLIGGISSPNTHMNYDGSFDNNEFLKKMIKAVEDYQKVLIENFKKESEER